MVDNDDQVKKKYIKYKMKYLKKKYLFMEQINDINTNPNSDPYLNQLAYEIVDWINMFKIVKAKYPNSKLYLKGGSTLGLYILSLIPKNMASFKSFMKLNLIKDWDFSIIIPHEYDNFVYPPNTSKCKHGLYKEFFDLVTTKISPNSNKMRVKFRSEGSKICIVRHAQKLMINDDVLFESSIHIKDKIITCFMDLEIPLTAMYFELKNISETRSFFNVAFAFSYINQQSNKSTETIDKNKLNNIVNIIQKYVSKQTIIPIPAHQGLFKINKPSELCYGEKYDPKLRVLFDAFDCTLSEKQFILSQYFQIDRLLIRFVNKNIPKSNMIKDYFIATQINYSKEQWILSESHVMGLIDKFNKYLYDKLFKTSYEKLNDIFDDLSDDSNKIVAELFNTLDEFFEKCNMKRVNEFYTQLHNNVKGNSDLYRPKEQKYIQNVTRTLNIFFDPIDEKYYNVNIEKYLKMPNQTYIFFKYLVQNK